MRKKTIHFNNIFSRLLFFNIILIFIATVLPQATFFNYFINKYEKNMEEMNYGNIKQVRDFVDEAIFERLVAIPVTHFSDITSNDILTYPINNDIRNQSYQILETSKQLYSIQMSYPFVRNINVFYSYNNLLFRGSNVFFLNSEKKDMRVKDTWLYDIINSDTRLSWTKINDNNTAFVYTRSIPYYDSSQGNRAVLSVEVDAEAFINAIEKTRNSKSGVFCLISTEGDIIFNTFNNKLDLNAHIGELQKIGSAINDGFTKYKVGNKEFFISYANSNYNEWKYVSVLPVSDVFSALNDMKILLLLLGAVFVCLNIAFAFFITKKAHSPMENIVKSVKSYSGHEEAASAKQNQYKLLEETFSSLTVKVDELNEHLSANKPIIFYNMVKRLLTSQNQEIYHDAEMFDFKKPLFVSFIIRIYHFKEMTIHNRMMVNYRINDLLNMGNNRFDIYSITDENDLVYGIINFDNNDDFNRLSDDFYNLLQKEISTPLVLCLGQVVCDMKDVANSYKSALEMKKYAFFSIENHTFCYDDLKLSQLKATGSSEKALEKMCISIKNKDWTQLEYFIDAIFETVISGRYTADYSMNTLIDLVSSLRKTVISMGYNAEALYSGDIREQMKALVNINEFKVWLNQIITVLIQAAADKKDDSSQQLKAKIEEYVNTNIFNDLTLSKMSEDLNISQSHLSRIFKPMLGMNCSEYLIAAKMNKAQELLNTTNLTVNQISEKLGYYSTAHFIRVFKTTYGCTPKQSRKNK